MTVQLSIPVTVAPEAGALIAELGHEQIFDLMLEKASQVIPGSVEMVVLHVPDYDEGADPGILIMGHVDARVGIANNGHERWRDWKLSTFPTEIWRHYSLCTAPVEVADARLILFERLETSSGLRSRLAVTS
jgi:hypothetical protein